MGEIHGVIAGFMRGRIKGLFHSKAALAQLRRGIGREIGELPELLGFVLPTDEITSWADGEDMVEKATYTALTLYAFHQQGSDKCMSAGLEEKEAAVSYKNSFGHAVRNLVKSDQNMEAAVTRRFDKVLTAKDVTELAVHARGLIGLLKKENITLDYPSFAVDLYWFQQQDVRRKVLLKWGKDYYMNKGRED
jgi:CRISPR system Cascade subunit CasB